MKNILYMQAFLSLGNAITGFFFAFLLMDKFTLSFEEILFIFGLEYGAISLFVFHLHKINFFSIQQKLATGIFFLITSLLFLIFSDTSVISLIAIIISTTLHISLLFPSLHWINIEQIDQSTRGSFLGSMQALNMGALIIGPLVSGFLIDLGYKNYIVLLSIIFYIISLIFAIHIPISKKANPTLPTLKEAIFFFKTQTLKKSFFQMSLVEAVQNSSLILVYPILLKISLKKYALMGGMFFIMAIIEIVTAKVVGFLTDKYSSAKLMKWGAFARALDIAPRGLLAFFPHALLATTLSVSAGLLGPLFGVSFYSQVYKRAEESIQSYTFLITREWILGIARAIFFILTAISFHLIGIYALAFALFLAGFLSFFLKEM
ncbi:TPA: MFS transporter [Candidatus Gracilibacteria bacterium]|nr:MFS transporter [Candidatus Gracilibacteria bacterium]